MTDKDYSNRELDLKLEAVKQTSTNNSEVIIDKMQNMQNALELRITDNDRDYRGSLTRIETQVAFTNGKVRKIIIALILLFGISIGLGFDKADILVKLLIGI